MRQLILSCIAIWAFLPAADGRAQTTAADVDFDDSATTQIQGMDVQEALESTDAALSSQGTALTSQSSASGVSFDDSTMTNLQGTNVQEGLASVDVRLTELHGSVAPNASVVHVRKDCTDVANCFQTMADLTDWIWNIGFPAEFRTFAPDADDPLLVSVGPGEFDPFVCENTDPDPTKRGYITLRGSGREQTILADDAGDGVAVRNCQDLSFIDIGMRGGDHGVFWNGGGSSSWSNTDMVATGAVPLSSAQGWYDACDGQSPVGGIHYFHSSRVRAAGVGTNYVSPFTSNCGENWFFGGEILADVSGSAGNVWLVTVIQQGDVRLFGTAVRGRILPGGSVVNYRGVFVDLGAKFHSHGSIINVSAEGATVNTDVYGLVVGFFGAAFAHTPGTTWVLKPGLAGSATRIQTIASGAVAHSPFLWQSGTTPPDISSQTGSDLFVETDCDTGGCVSVGTPPEPHLLIYSNACTVAGPWFDVVTGGCRQ